MLVLRPYAKDVENGSFPSNKEIMAEIQVNEESFYGKKVSIIGNKVIIDGQVTKIDDYNDISIVVNGDIEELTFGYCDQLQISGNAGNIEAAHGDINIEGDIDGNVTIKTGSVNCSDINGEVKTKIGDIDCNNIGGNVTTENGKVDCNDVSGNITTANGRIDIQGNVDGDITVTGSGKVDCGDVSGDVKTTDGNVDCNDVGGNVTTEDGDIDCGNISGDATTKTGNITCEEGDIEGDAKTESGYIDCGNVSGDVSTQSGNIVCGDVSGNVTTTTGDVDCDDVEGDVATESGSIDCGNVSGDVSINGDAIEEITPENDDDDEINTFDNTPTSTGHWEGYSIPCKKHSISNSQEAYGFLFCLLDILHKKHIIYAVSFKTLRKGRRKWEFPI